MGINHESMELKRYHCRFKNLSDFAEFYTIIKSIVDTSTIKDIELKIGVNKDVTECIYIISFVTTELKAQLITALINRIS